ncbi:hypothetical protein Ddye_013634 [Dipteronia dyeriana]|uniref:Cytochrome P450 n=1 Tax=Dipteronia dyeriana TaxID=168575 RepID=A0AAD9X6T1_9ROSI|nr:hypothetical protein Ddye_013634 [Dipteronia dyeriana]
MGVRLLQLALASLVYHFEWSLDPGQELDMDEIFGITLMKQQPLVLIPKLRKL